MQAVACGGPFNSSFNPASLAQYLEVLRDGRLGNGQIIDEVSGDTAGMGDQELHDFEADGVADCLEHSHQPLLLRSGDIERAARFWNYLSGFISHNVHSS